MVSELAKSLVEAQRKMKNPKFDAKNPHFKSKFASLRSAREAVLPVLNEVGIAVVQELTTIDGSIGCTVHLLHEMGEERSYGPFTVRPTKMDPQGQVSASTYVRRISLQSVACVVGAEDDDGHQASIEVETIDEEQQLNLFAIATEHYGDKAEQCLEAMAQRYFQLGHRDWSKIPAARYEDAVRQLKERAEES